MTQCVAYDTVIYGVTLPGN